MAFDGNSVGPFQLPQKFESIKAALKLKRCIPLDGDKFRGYLEDGKTKFLFNIDDGTFITGNKKYVMNVTFDYLEDVKEEEEELPESEDTIVHCVWADAPSGRCSHLHSSFTKRKDAETVRDRMSWSGGGWNFNIIMKYAKEVSKVYTSAQNFYNSGNYHGYDSD